MPEPVYILKAPEGLQILDASPYTVDELGLTKAVVTYICYPPDPSLYPKIGSRHPNYPALTLDEVESRTDVFGFITCTYFGVVGLTREIEEIQEWYELYAQPVYLRAAATQVNTTDPSTGVVTITIIPGKVTQTTQAQYLLRKVRRIRGVTQSEPGSFGPNWTVSAVKKGAVWLYTREYTWSQPAPAAAGYVP